MAESSPAITELLASWGGGSQEAFRALVPLLYDDLRRIAHQQLRRARADHTLQTTALAHEAYLRFERYPPSQFQSRAHFLAVCAVLMRQILTRYERMRRAAKRGSGPNLTLYDAQAVVKKRPIDLLALDDALNSLASRDPLQGRIVELRFFAGLSIEETAQVLGLSARTVKRHWSLARVWLYAEMTRGARA